MDNCPSFDHPLRRMAQLFAETTHIASACSRADRAWKIRWASLWQRSSVKNLEIEDYSVKISWLFSGDSYSNPAQNYLLAELASGQVFPTWLALEKRRLSKTSKFTIEQTLKKFVSTRSNQFLSNSIRCCEKSLIAEPKQVRKYSFWTLFIQIFECFLRRFLSYQNQQGRWELNRLEWDSNGIHIEISLLSSEFRWTLSKSYRKAQRKSASRKCWAITVEGQFPRRSSKKLSLDKNLMDYTEW